MVSGQSIESMKLIWSPKEQDWNIDEVSGWYLDKPKKTSELVALKRNGVLVNCSALAYTLKFKRVASYELLQTMIPSLMLSFASSSSLYVSHEKLPARIGLSGTTFLSMIALFKGSRYDFAVHVHLPFFKYLKI